MILSLLTQGILEISYGIITWTFKKGYDIVYYILYKDEYIYVNKKEYEEILKKIELEKIKKDND